MRRDVLARFLRAGLVTALADGLFSSVLSVAFYHSTVTRLWQGVASVVLGKSAFDGSSRTALIGLLLHVCVAFAWTAVFLFGVLRIAAVQRAVESWGGVMAVAAVYGPLIWVVMSLVVIPLLTHRPPTINIRWWIQFFGHMLFVGLPIVALTTRPARIN
ncbi:MAG: hypothetical protein JO197_21585 [Acidobacteria bacterium]|nr:hypothetical protein [Acidobacteriota bacterium]